jgi:hypothetical protein
MNVFVGYIQISVASIDIVIGVYLTYTRYFHKFIGREDVDGVLHYLVEWCPTIEPEYSLEHANELVDEFEAQLPAQRGVKSGRAARFQGQAADNGRSRCIGWPTAEETARPATEAKVRQVNEVTIVGSYFENPRKCLANIVVLTLASCPHYLVQIPNHQAHVPPPSFRYSHSTPQHTTNLNHVPEGRCSIPHSRNLLIAQRSTSTGVLVPLLVDPCVV